MKRLVILTLVAGLLLSISLPMAAQPQGEDLWTPDFNSPANFYSIQVDKETPAKDTVYDNYFNVSQKWPEAADNAQHASFVR